MIELLNHSDLHLLLRKLHVFTQSLFPKNKQTNKQTKNENRTKKNKTKQNKKSLTSVIRRRFLIPL